MWNYSMKRHSVYQLTVLSLCCVLITGRDPERIFRTFVPGLRCRCPETQNSVRGQLKDFRVLPSNPNCDVYTVIVVLKRNNAEVCVNPQSRMGRQLIRCFKKATKLGRDVKLCLRRSGKRRPQQKTTRGS